MRPPGASITLTGAHTSSASSVSGTPSERSSASASARTVESSASVGGESHGRCVGTRA